MKEKNSFSPAYLRLYKQFRQDIISGIYSFGSKLPSKRKTAERYDVSVITVEHAYGILCDEGYLESRCRSGYYVIYRLHDAPQLSESPVAKTNSASMVIAEDSIPYSVLVKIYRRVLNESGESLLCRSPNSGCLELRKALADYLYRSRSLSVTPNQIIIGSGAEFLYGLVVQLLGRTRRYGIENPSYDKILAVYRSNGASCDGLTMGDDGVLTSELQRTDATVLHVTPFNSYPSGVTATASKRQEYVRWATGRDGYIVEDDYDSEFTTLTKSEDTIFSLNPQRVIYMNTFSRTIAPSLRVGYMVLPLELLEVFQKTLGNFSCPVPVLEQYVLANLLDGGEFERHLNRVRRKRRRGK
ncbi:MAG: PLP-dependent aminotransferase family protein [Clostridia bacterium]|nr:PLP-dependent aminotransferase family protein [Clostridia bacterium]